MQSLVSLRYLFGLLLVLITWKLHFVRGQDCNESGLRQCLTSLRLLVQDEFNHVRRTEEELDEFCSSVQRDSFCHLGKELCKKDYPVIAELSEALFLHLNQVCNKASGRRTVYLKMLPCFDKYEKDFDKCAGGLLAGPSGDQVTEVCTEMKSMLCVANTSEKFCGEDGAEFGKSLEKGLKETYEGECSAAATGVSISYWILLSSALAFVLSKNKMGI